MLKCAHLLLVLLAVATVTHTALADPSDAIPGVVELTSASFDAVVNSESGKYVFVEFYAPWCSHCKNFVQEYTTVAAAVAGSPEEVRNKLVLAKLDATKNEDIAKRFSVNSFPTIFLFSPGSDPQRYRSRREAHLIAEFLASMIPEFPLLVEERVDDPLAYVMTLTANSFDREVMSPEKDVAVLFYAPWCGHCKRFKSIYSAVAELFERDSNHTVLARLDATKPNAEEIAQRYNIKSFPTIYLFPKGKKNEPILFNGIRDKTNFLHFLDSNIDCPRLLDGDVSWKCGVRPELTDLLHAYLRAESEETMQATLTTLQDLISNTLSVGAPFYKSLVEGMVQSTDARRYLLSKEAGSSGKATEFRKGPERDAQLIMDNILRDVELREYN